MALEERGRRVTLKADISQLQRAFNKVNAIARQSTTELKKIGQAMKFDPHNMALLTRHQKELNRVVAQNYKLIGNLKKQIAKNTQLGDTQAVQKLTNKLEILRSKNEGLKASLRETNKTLANLGNVQGLAKLESELRQSKVNVESLNKALKLDTGNINVAATKFRELKSQADNLDKQVLILVQDLKKVDVKTDPQGFNKIKAKLEETRAEAKHAREELKKLGDTKFNPALVQLEKLDQELKKSRETGKSLNRELEFKPRDSILKSLRLEEARNELTKTREKVKLLKSELSKVKTANNREEFTRLNLKIAESNRHTKELIKSFKVLNATKLNGVSGALTSLGGSLERNAKAMRDAGRNFTLGYTLPVTYGMGRVLNEFRNTDDGLRRVAAAASDGVRERFTTSFKEVEASARESSKGTVYSMKQVAGGMEELIKANWKSADAQREVINVMNLAKVEGMELAQATEIVADGLASFGMKAEETARFTDVLTMASIKSTTDITKMGETLKYVAPVAGTLGYTIEDTATAISIMANNGIKASVAGTSLRAGLTNLVKPSKQAKAALDSIGFSMTDANGKTKPLIQVISELREKTKGMTEAQKAHFSASVFGKTAMSGWMAILNASGKSVEELTNAIKNSKGATKEMADQLTSGVGGAFDRFKASVSNTSYEVGKSLAPALKTVIDGATGMVTSLGEASDGTKIFVSSLVGVTAAIPPLTWAIGGGITQFIRFKNAMMTTFTSPIGAALTLGTTLGLSISALKSKYDPLMKAQNNTKESAEKLGGVFDRVAMAINKYKETLESTTGVLDKIYGKNNNFKNSINDITNLVNTKYEEITSIVAKATEELRSLNTQEATTIRDNINTINGMHDKRISKERQAYQEVMSINRNLNADRSISNQDYEKQFASHIKQIQDLHKNSEQSTKDWVEQLKTLNSKLPPELQLRNEEIERLQQKLLESDKQLYSESIEAALKGYEDRTGVERDYIAKIKENKDSLNQLEKDHAARSKQIWEENSNNLHRYNALMKEEDIKYEAAKKLYLDNITNMSDDNRVKQAAVYLQGIQDAINNGATLSAVQAENVRAFLQTMENMPQETREKMTKGLKDAGVDVDALGNALAEQMKIKGIYINDSFAEGLNAAKSDIELSMNTTLQSLVGLVDVATVFNEAQDMLLTGRDGINAGKSEVDSAMDGVMQGAKDKVQTTDLSPTGQEKSQEIARGIKERDGDVWNAAQETANHGKNAAQSISFFQPGWEMAAGLAQGVYSGSGYLSGAVRNIVARALEAGRREADSHSPSRKFRDFLGITLPQGVAVGIDRGAGEVEESMTNLMKGALTKAQEFKFSDKLSSIANFSTAGNYAIQHTVSQNSIVVDTLNTLISKVNDLELRSDIFLDGEKVGNATYKRHEVIDRRLGLA